MVAKWVLIRWQRYIYELIICEGAEGGYENEKRSQICSNIFDDKIEDLSETEGKTLGTKGVDFVKKNK